MGHLYVAKNTVKISCSFLLCKVSYYIPWLGNIGVFLNAHNLNTVFIV